MKVTEAPETRSYILELARKQLEAMPRILEPGVAHASELELCPLKPHYARTLKEQPPLSDESILQFLRGRGMEFFVGGELPVLTKDGICGTIDGRAARIIEFKSTQSDLGRFKVDDHDWWIQRCKAYCSLAVVPDIDLIVWFLNGSMGTDRKIKTDIRAWTLTFTEEELWHNWNYLKAERERMFACIAGGTLPDEAWVKERRKSFECKSCRYSTICPQFESFKK